MESTLEIVCPAWYRELQRLQVDRLIDAIPLLADQGVTAIEVSADLCGYFDYHDAYELEQFVARLASSGIRAHSVHMPFGPGCDISSLDDGTQERGVDALIDSIELASVIEAGVVVVHASDAITNGSNGRMERARGVLREMAAVAKESAIVLAVENLPPGYLGHTPEQVMELLEGTDHGSIGVCFDSGHANLSGHFDEFADALLPYAVTTHIHDNDGVQDQHHFPGEGTIDWPKFASTYHKLGSHVGAMLECAPPNGLAWSEAFQRFRAALGE